MWRAVPWPEYVARACSPLPGAACVLCVRCSSPIPQLCCRFSLPCGISPLAFPPLVSQARRGPWSLPGTLSGELHSSRHLSLAVVARGCLAWPQFPRLQTEARMTTPRSLTPFRPLGQEKVCPIAWILSGPWASLVILGPGFIFFSRRSKASPSSCLFSTWYNGRLLAWWGLGHVPGRCPQCQSAWAAGGCPEGRKVGPLRCIPAAAPTVPSPLLREEWGGALGTEPGVCCSPCGIGGSISMHARVWVLRTSQHGLQFACRDERTEPGLLARSTSAVTLVTCREGLWKPCREASRKCSSCS